MKRQNKGITLIALVITIILLLILAGTTISTLRQTKLFSNTEKAKEKYLIEQYREELYLKVSEVQLNKKGNANLQDIVDYLNNDKNNTYEISLDGKIIGITNVGEATQIYVKYKGYLYRIDSGFNIEHIENIDDENDKSGRYYIYREGNEYTDIAGEWWNNEKVPEYSKGNLQKEENYMIYTAIGITSYNPTCTKAETMDISTYDSINIELEIIGENTETSPDRNIGIRILNENGNIQYSETFYRPNMNIGTASINIGEKTTISKDISELENLDNVYFGLENNGYKVKIYSIYLARNEKKMLYNYGKEYEEICGEWVNNPLIPDSETTGKLTKNSDHMLFEITSVNVNPTCTKKELINIKEYDKFKVEFEPISLINYEWRNISLSVLDSLGNIIKGETKCGPTFGKSDYIGEKRVESLDISDLTDKQKEQVYFGICGNSYNFKIYRIWLEKVIK